MADLQITVFKDAGVVALGDPVSEQKVAIGGTSTPSTVLPGTKVFLRVRLFAEADCYVTWAAVPVALQDGTEGRMLGAGNPEYFSIEAGDKIAVIERV